MRRWVWTIALISSLVASQFAMASNESKVISARGLAEFEASRYSKALELFDRAVKADPSDAFARYYRAATKARVDDYDGAIEDLRRVLELEPEFDQAALDLGVALIEKAQYAEAAPWLEQARGNPDMDARASLFLGIAQLRMGRNEEARANFRRAEGNSENRLAARYYLGVTSYKEERWSEAAEQFAYVLETSPESSFGREAAAFLAKLGGVHGRRYQLYGTVGFQYDSNVILAPSGDVSAAESVLNVSQNADGRFTFGAGGTGVLWRNDSAELSVAYDFYQSLHLELQEFDLQDHGPSIQLSGTLGPARLGLLSRYDYYLLDGDDFLQQVSGMPWLMIPTWTVGRAEVTYRVQWRDYLTNPFSVRDAFNHALGVRQVFYLGSADKYVSVGYQYDREQPIVRDDLVRDGLFTEEDVNSFAYDGHQVTTGLGWALPFDASAEVTYAYRREFYSGDSSLFTPSGKRRIDDAHRVVVGIQKRLLEWFVVTIGYLAEFNDSNDPRFKYDRHIGSLTLEARY